MDHTATAKILGGPLPGIPSGVISALEYAKLSTSTYRRVWRSLPVSDDAAIISSTVHWVERAVIGLNLCPFAKAVERRGQVRYVVSRAKTADQLLADLRTELDHLAKTPADVTDNTLLIHPDVLQEFFAFQSFLPRTASALRKAGFEGMFQIASFHPDYQFADAEPEDLGNFTNRAPYPTLHLLREASITVAVSAFPAAEIIHERNLATLSALGREGWEKLGIKPAGDGDTTCAEH